MANENRRTVKGLAFRECDFCHRHKLDKQGRPYNFQYINEQTGEWDKNVYCTKECRKAWHTQNACAEYLSRRA